MSQCPSAYLLEVASLYDWMADKDEEQGRTYKNKQGKDVATAPFKRKDAARCRGWAKRNESLGKAKVPSPPPQADPFAGGSAGDYSTYSDADDSEIPF
jgi:hypothetical protein